MPGKLRTFGGRVLLTNTRAGAAPFDQAATLAKALGSGSGGGGTTPTVPDQVTGLVLNGTVTDGDTPLAWTAAARATSYKVRQREFGSTAMSVVQSGITATNTVILGLPGIADQEFSVAGTNAAGDGPYSTWTRVAIPANPTNPTTPPQSGTRLITTTGVPHRFKAPQAIPAGYPISFAMGFAPGDYPTSSRLRMVVAGTGGAVVPVQTDQHWAVRLNCTAYCHKEFFRDRSERCGAVDPRSDRPRYVAQNLSQKSATSA